MPFQSMNIGSQCGDQPAAVAENRRRLNALLPANVGWLNQLHTANVVKAGSFNPADSGAPVADAIWTDAVELPCVISTADCLPVLFCTSSGSSIAAIHCGWRSLAAGILEATLAAMPLVDDALLVWFGPTISAPCYEVGVEVFNAFVEPNRQDKYAFKPTRRGHWQADLIQLAKLRLQRAGHTRFYGGHWCTYTDPRFFSYRRDKQTGRMATAITRI